MAGKWLWKPPPSGIHQSPGAARPWRVAFSQYRSGVNGVAEVIPAIWASCYRSFTSSVLASFRIGKPGSAAFEGAPSLANYFRVWPLDLLLPSVDREHHPISSIRISGASRKTSAYGKFVSPAVLEGLGRGGGQALGPHAGVAQNVTGVAGF
jgi:hypothetical protein